MAMAAALVAAPANAATEVFDAAGLFEDGSSFTGTVTIDTTAGLVLGADLDYSGAASATFDQIQSQGYDSFSADYVLNTTSLTAPSAFHLGILGTTLVGYAGGDLASHASLSPNRYFSALHPDASDVIGLAQGALTPAAVPEPSIWALTIAGFGMAGATIRRRRALSAA